MARDGTVKVGAVPPEASDAAQLGVSFGDIVLSINGRSSAGMTSFDALEAKGLAVSGSWDSTLKVWSLADGSCPRTLQGHSGRVYCVRADCAKGLAISGS